MAQTTTIASSSSAPTWRSRPQRARSGTPHRPRCTLGARSLEAGHRSPGFGGGLPGARVDASDAAIKEVADPERAVRDHQRPGVSRSPRLLQNAPAHRVDAEDGARPFLRRDPNGTCADREPLRQIEGRNALQLARGYPRSNRYSDSVAAPLVPGSTARSQRFCASADQPVPTAPGNGCPGTATSASGSIPTPSSSIAAGNRKERGSHLQAVVGQHPDRLTCDDDPTRVGDTGRRMRRGAPPATLRVEREQVTDAVERRDDPDRSQSSRDRKPGSRGHPESVTAKVSGSIANDCASLAAEDPDSALAARHRKGDRKIGDDMGHLVRLRAEPGERVRRRE